jgi:hypothetical protein
MCSGLSMLAPWVCTGCFLPPYVLDLVWLPLVGTTITIASPLFICVDLACLSVCHLCGGLEAAFAAVGACFGAPCMSCLECVTAPVVGPLLFSALSCLGPAGFPLPCLAPLAPLVAPLSACLVPVGIVNAFGGCIISWIDACAAPATCINAMVAPAALINACTDLIIGSLPVWCFSNN